MQASRAFMVSLIILALFLQPFLTGIVGPVFAANTVQITPGGTGGGGATNFLVASMFTAGSTGTVTDLGIKLSSSLAAGNKLVLGIYQDSSNYPGTLLGQTNEITSGSAGWISAPLKASVSISASTNYWLAYFANVGGEVSYDMVGTSHYYQLAYTSTMPANFQATSGSQSDTYALEYIETTGPDFSIGASPGSQSIGAGASAFSTLTLTALGGYSDQVDLVITSGCSATGMTCTLNGSPAYSVPGGSGTVSLAVSTLVSTPPAAYPVVVTGTDHVNSAITHQATFTVTVGPATSYQFNVKGTATQIVVTLTYSWTGSGTPPQESVTISSPSGVCSPSCLEAAGAVYDRTSIAVSNAGNTYSIIHRVIFTITAPGALPAWTAYVTLSGVSTYTVTIEVS